MYDGNEIIKRARDYLGNETNKTFRKQVQTLLDRGNVDELRERFYADLVFGTGGLRGIIGGGTNRMNSLVVRRVTQALALYVQRCLTGAPSAVIAHDSRHCSDLFARDAARVLCANGFIVYLFPRLAPTPILSFMVRQLHASTGIVITASHNPPEYNGYKVYWNDGAQIVSPHDEGIINEIKKTGRLIKEMSLRQAKKQGRLRFIRARDLDGYYEIIMKRLNDSGEPVTKAKKLSCVYTPLHGAGLVPVITLFKRMGLTLRVVPEQKKPDGNFPTVDYPNPEIPETFTCAFRYAQKFKADIILATDPDADRLGVAVLQNDAYTLISGNELGVLLLDYILRSRQKAGRLAQKAYMVKTIVTTELQRLIADQYRILCIDTLTGFKNICAVMREMEREKPDHEFLFGNEESYGYLMESDVRDKDGVSAAALAAQMALSYKSQGLTLLQRLDEIFGHYGYFQETQINKYYEGEDGIMIIREIMDELRTSRGEIFTDEGLLVIKDYLSQTTIDCRDGTIKKDISLVASDVLQFFIDRGGIITARPSGTEPKIKFYVSLRIMPPFDRKQARQALEQATERLHGKINRLLERSRL